MPGSTTGRFTDAEDYQNSLADLAIELVVTQAGAFHAQLTLAKLPNMRLLRAHETLARVAYIALPPASIFVSFPARTGPPLFWNGVELGPGVLVFHSRGERLHQRIVGPSHWGFLAVAPTFFARYGSALAGYRLEAPSVGRIVRPPHPDLVELLGLHARIAHLVETRPVTIGHPEVDRALEEEMLHALVTCLDDRDAYDGPNTDQHCLQIMRQFEEVLANRPEHRLRVPDVCAILGVTEPALRTCCDAFLGINPSHYLLLRRLKLAQAAMLRTDPMTARVGDIAKRYGFPETSRFAAAYRLAFGENPSATLARLRYLRR
jgi:AraC-like DNA-binding protein